MPLPPSTKLRVVFCYNRLLVLPATVREGGNTLGEPVHLNDEDWLDCPLLMPFGFLKTASKSAQ
jgi:hypothetical protein